MVQKKCVEFFAYLPKLSIHHLQTPTFPPGNKAVNNRYFSESNSSTSTIPQIKTLLHFLGGVGWVCLIGTFLMNYPQIIDLFCDVDRPTRQLLSNLQKSRIDFRLKDFQDRSALLQTIKSLICTDTYLILYGPKGSGKTTLIDYSLKDQKSVVKIAFRTGTSKEKIIKQLSLKLLGEYDEWSDLLIHKIKSLPEPPTIVFEIEGGDIEKPSDIESLCRNLNGFAKCIIVLSEANTILHFDQYRHREKVLYVGEFTPQEAQDYLRLRGIELTPKQMDYVVSQVGTMPIWMSNLAYDVRSAASNSKDPNGPDSPKVLRPSDEIVEEFVRSQLFSAWNEIGDFPDQSLLQQLKQSPNGVPSDGKNLKKLMLANGTNVITIHNNHRIVLQSTAHKTALKKYDCNKTGQFNPFEKITT